MPKFFEAKITDFRVNSREVLEAFIKRVDDEINIAGITVLNHAFAEAKAIAEEEYAQDIMMTSNIQQFYTTSGIKFTTTSSKELHEGKPLQEASTEQMQFYYAELAGIVEIRKKANCVIFAAFVIEQLKVIQLEDDNFRNIIVRMCFLKDWEHAFLKVELPNEQECLFYDPWYPRCSEKELGSMPFIFSKEQTTNIFRSMASEMYHSGCIKRVIYLMNLDQHGCRNDPYATLNLHSSFEHQVVFSSRSESVPTLLPKGSEQSRFTACCIS